MFLFKSSHSYLFPSQKFAFTLHSVVSRPNISSWQQRTELSLTSPVYFQKFQIYLFLSGGRTFCFVNFNISVSAIRRDLLCYSTFLSPSLPFQNCTNPTKSIMSQRNKVSSQNFCRLLGQICKNNTHILYLKQRRWCSGIKRHKIFCDEINFSLDRNKSCHPWLSGWPTHKKWQDRWSKSESTWLPQRLFFIKGLAMKVLTSRDSEEKNFITQTLTFFLVFCPKMKIFVSLSHHW